MKSITVIALAVVAVLCVKLAEADNLSVGQNVGATLAYVENVKLGSVPFYSREKNINYSNPQNRPIRGIFALEVKSTKAKPAITAGGIGLPHANVRIKGESGKALEYQVQFYV